MLATQTPVDLLGFMLPARRQIKDPITGEMIDGANQRVLASDVDDERLRACRSSTTSARVIIFDEADKCEADVTKTSAEIRLNRALGPWRFDKRKVGCIALVNRVEDRSGSGKKFDFIINRQSRVHRDGGRRGLA